MKCNPNWVYRNIYDCNILINMSTNEIICLSDILSELFIGSNFDNTFQEWIKTYNLSEKEANAIIKTLTEKEVIYE